MLALRESGYALYVPFGENTRCDLLIEQDDCISRAQCKNGRLRKGALVFAVCSCYGHHRNPEAARRSYQGQVDYFAVFCPETPRCISRADRGHHRADDRSTPDRATATASGA